LQRAIKPYRLKGALWKMQDGWCDCEGRYISMVSPPLFTEEAEGKSRLRPGGTVLSTLHCNLERAALANVTPESNLSKK